MTVPPSLVGEIDQYRAFWDQHLNGLIEIQRKASESGSAEAYLALLNDFREMPDAVVVNLAAAAVQRLCREELP